MSNTDLVCFSTVSPGRPRISSVKEPVWLSVAPLAILTIASRLMFVRLMFLSTSGSVDCTEAPTCSASPRTLDMSTIRSFWFFAVATMMFRGQPLRRRDSASQVAVCRSALNMPQFRSASCSVGVFTRAST